jgi:hypothetical protein
MAQLSLFAEDIRRPALQARSNIRLGDAAEAFVIAKPLKAGFDAHDAPAMRLMTLALTSERGGIAASRLRGANEHITGNGTFVLFGETPGPGPGPMPT